MRKKQDIMWEQSTLWESVEKWVTKYLKKNHSEYRELQVKAMRIVGNHGDRNGGHLIGYDGLISVPVAQ